MIAARRLKLLCRIGLSMLIPYVFLVLAVTVFLRTPAETSNIVLEPFRTYRDFFADDFTHFEIRANILLFIPIGILLPMVKKTPWYLPIFVGIAFSVIIELIQFISHRGMCETDDVISNTIGLLIGIGAFWLVKALVLLVKHIITKNKTQS